MALPDSPIVVQPPDFGITKPQAQSVPVRIIGNHPFITPARYVPKRFTGADGGIINLKDYIRNAKSIAVMNPHGIIDTNTQWLVYFGQNSNGYPMQSGDAILFSGPFTVGEDLFFYANNGSAWELRTFIEYLTEPGK